MLVSSADLILGLAEFWVLNIANLTFPCSYLGYEIGQKILIILSYMIHLEKWLCLSSTWTCFCPRWCGSFWLYLCFAEVGKPAPPFILVPDWVSKSAHWSPGFTCKIPAFSSISSGRLSEWQDNQSPLPQGLHQDAHSLFAALCNFSSCPWPHGAFTTCTLTLTFPEGFLSDTGTPPVQSWVLVCFLPCFLVAFCSPAPRVFPGCLSPFLPLIVPHSCSSSQASCHCLMTTRDICFLPLPHIPFQGGLSRSVTGKFSLSVGELELKCPRVLGTLLILCKISHTIPECQVIKSAGAAETKVWLFLACVGGWSIPPQLCPWNCLFEIRTEQNNSNSWYLILQAVQLSISYRSAELWIGNGKLSLIRSMGQP